MFSVGEKFKSVGSDVVQSVGKLVSQVARTDPPEQPITEGSTELSLCGFELLSHFQQDWRRIHEASQRNYARANVVHAKLNDICVHCRKWRADIDSMTSEFAGLDSLADKITSMTSFVENLMDECDSILHDTHQYQLLRDDQRFEQRKIHETAKLSTYRNAKQQQLANVLADMADRVAVKSAVEQKQLAERHSTFECLSNNEIEHYRQHRQLADSRLPVSDSESPTQLQDVDLAQEASNEELEKFLSESLQ